MSEPKLLRTYVDDRLAVAVVGRELVKRMLRRTDAGASRPALEQARRELEGAERELESVLAQMGARPSRVKFAAAWAAEKAGRLKLNGRILSQSPLSPVQELEGLTAILLLVAMTFRSLERVRPELAKQPSGFEARAQRVDDLRVEIEALRLTAVERALA
jgi:hypothetical protein